MNERVELDRLADFAAGALDGTPEQAELAHLIAAEPAWAQAYHDLVTADANVREQLDMWGRLSEPMPVDVAGRLDLALATAREHDGRGHDRKGVDDLDPVGSATVISLATVRRRRRWTAVTVAAAAVVAFALFGLPVLFGSIGGGADMSSSGGGQADQAERGAAPALGPSDSVITMVSGLDYQRDSLRAMAQRRLDGTADGLPNTLNSRDGATVPEELLRLTALEARRDCLLAITRLYPLAIRSVDYARFEGSAALVVALVNAAAQPARVVVAGPACGLQGGADVRYTSTVG